MLYVHDQCKYGSKNFRGRGGGLDKHINLAMVNTTHDKNDMEKATNL
jgi:hypothetical protein